MEVQNPSQKDSTHGAAVSPQQILILKGKNAPVKSSVRWTSHISNITPVSHFTNFGTENGLALTSSTCSYLDHSGTLWFGTGGAGVSRFDGKEFFTMNTTLGLAQNVVRSITQDKNNHYWFATSAGASRYDGKIFKTFSTRDGLPHNLIYSITKDNSDRLWFGTFGGGVSVYDGKTFTNFNDSTGLVNNFVRCIFSDSKGNVWFGTVDGVSQFYGNKFVALDFDLRGKIVYNITEDNSGNIWFATSKGAFQYDGARLHSYGVDDGLPDQTILSIKQDRSGRLWFGTHEGGLALLKKNGDFEVFNTEHGLPHPRIWSINEDVNGNIWLTTQGGGISRFNGDAFKSYSRRNGLIHDVVWSITQDNERNVWFGTDDGLSKFDGVTFSSMLLGKTLAENLVHSMCGDEDGGMWLGTGGGAVYMKDGIQTRYTTANGLPNNVVRNVLKDSNGRIWFATLQGVACLSGDTMKTFTTKQGLITNAVRKIIEDRKGILWITSVEGLCRYNGKSFESFARADGLVGKRITTIIEDQSGMLWIGTHGSGLVRYDGENFLPFGIKEGIPDLVIYELGLSTNGDLWAGTNLGFIKLSFSKQNVLHSAGALLETNTKLKNDYQFVWDQYNQRTGYPAKDFNIGSLYISEKKINKDGSIFFDGLIWGGFGNNRVSTLDPSKLRKRTVSSKPILRSVKINDENVPWVTLLYTDSVAQDSLALHQNEIFHLGKPLTPSERESFRQQFTDIRFSSVSDYSRIPESLVLPYDQNSITFSFTLIETGIYDQVRYQFQLKGLDKDWTAVTSKPEVTYGNLWEGEYTFMLKGQNPAGVWTDPIEYSFRVLPPWYRTWWMYATYLLLFIGGAVLFIRWRERKLQGEKRMLEQMVTERTQELQAEKDRALTQMALVEEMNEEIQTQLDLIEKDLSRQTLQMIHRTNNLMELEAEIKKMSTGLNPAEFQKLLRMITINKSLDKEWESFNIYFSNVHKDFLERIKQHSSQLSIYEMRLCALVRLGLENREIATLLNIEPSSVKMAKYRLKKKLGLDEAQDLFQFITHF